VKVGLILPQGYFNEYDGWDPEKAWGRTLELAMLAERLGFESLWFGEHVLPKWNTTGIAFDCVALAAAAVWSVAVAAGFAVLWKYKTTPGHEEIATPIEWPVDAALARSPRRATLLMFALAIFTVFYLRMLSRGAESDGTSF